MIKFISAPETLPLRKEVLRANKLDLRDCVFDGDHDENAFHLGYFEKDLLVSVATFHSQNLSNYGYEGYQLRGMATQEVYREKGIGNKLLNFAIVYLRGKNAKYIWCNARQIAFKFYLSLGFEFISEEFEIPEIGIHRKMYLKIR
ncbi:GCN5 family acetyltransferase [Pelobium manganitolerans]|uniref:GCN5 family acetyltransferase n=1 Tax=Pelobium manganitolerans TaxID=1842495 RepID=A0A419S7D7_9SPHI|nr:GNAT family N-acetyltransferase [Pelobium manganitolerans]RKD17245.1 GCN5 family acetyltransferase [Pelobium manganitolerans]